MMKGLNFVFMVVVLLQFQLLSASFFSLSSFSRDYFPLVSGDSSSEGSNFFGYGFRIPELDSGSFPSYIRGSHKPTFVLFYAPWCGHCQRFKEEYVRLAVEVAGSARVAAVNVDLQPALGNEFQIKGFPTVLFWGLGSKEKAEPVVYEGARTSSALRSFLISQVSRIPARIELVETAATLQELVKSSPYGLAAVFFSSRSHPPPMMRVMSLSPKLAEMPFIFVDKAHSEEVGKAFNVTKIPTVATVSIEASGETRLRQYNDARFIYEDVARFFFRILDYTKSRLTGAERQEVPNDRPLEDM